jgi:hypothetical protein
MVGLWCRALEALQWQQALDHLSQAREALGSFVQGPSYIAEQRYLLGEAKCQLCLKAVLHGNVMA